MKINKLLSGFLLLSTLLLVSCGSGDNGSGAPIDTGSPDIEHTDPNTTALKLRVPDSIDLSDTRYSVAGGLESASVTDETIKIPKDTKTMVSLLRGRSLILSGRKYSGDSSVDLSLESSAVVMVLMQPRFLGTSSIKPKELEKRIKAHNNFQELTNAIEIDVNNESPCPIDPVCNSEAGSLADEIATEIKIKDLF